MNPQQRKSVAWTMFGNRREKLHKLGHISPKFSPEIGDNLRSKFKYSYVGLPPIFENTSKFVKNTRLRLAISTLLGVWKSDEVLLLVFELLLLSNYV